MIYSFSTLLHTSNSFKAIERTGLSQLGIRGGANTNRGFLGYRRAGQKDFRRKRLVLNYKFKLNFSRNLFVKYLDIFMRKGQCILKIAN